MQIIQDVEIIHAEPERWKEYKKIYLEELRTVPEAFLNSYEHVLSYPDTHWKTLLTERVGDIYVAQTAGKIVGMAGITRGAYPKNAHTASLWGVYVRTSYRRNGIARLLLNRIVKDLAVDPAVTKLSLGVISSQVEALALYRSLGFTVAGCLKNERKIGNTYYDEILMEMPLVLSRG